MNKAELIMKVSERANVTQKVAKVIVDTLFDGMKESLEKGRGSRSAASGASSSGTTTATRAATPRRATSSRSRASGCPSSRLGKN